MLVCLFVSLFSVFVETSRMCYYGFTLEVRITGEMYPMPGTGDSKDLIGLQIPGEDLYLHKTEFSLREQTYAVLKQQKC